MEIFNKIDMDILEGIQKKDVCETRNIKISYEVLAPGTRQKKHVHRLIDEIFLVMEGEGLCCVNDDNITIKKGNLIWIQANDIHFLVNTSGSFLKLLLISEKSKVDDIVTIE